MRSKDVGREVSEGGDDARFPPLRRLAARNGDADLAGRRREHLRPFRRDVLNRSRVDAIGAENVGVDAEETLRERDVMGRAEGVMIAQVAARDQGRHFAGVAELELAEPQHLLKLVGVGRLEGLAGQPHIEVHRDTEPQLPRVGGRLRDLRADIVVGDLLERRADARR